ncbi:hypothetical protein KKB44_01495 [Candidatus Micrarchaeota archaeon]|nr:hypothetical protein [Candidatus Micrarchaeota archaeon]
MLRPKKMKKVRVIVLKSAVEKLLKNLHEAGLVDIRKTVYKGLEEGRPLSSFEEISAQLLELRVIQTLMGPQTSKKLENMSGEVALKEAKEFYIGKRLKELNKEATQLSEKQSSLESQIAIVEKIMHFKGVNFGRLDTKTVSFKIGELPNTKIAELQKKMTAAKTYCRVISDPSSTITLVLYEEKDVSVVDALLTEAAFDEIELPDNITTPQETRTMLIDELRITMKRVNEVKKEMQTLSQDNYDKVISLIKSLETEADRADIATKFAASRSLYVIEGWIPEEDYSKLDNIISKETATLQDVKYGHNVMPPTVLDNPDGASPFEFLTKSYSLPNYFELDPTLPYLICLPIIYGMIVGDFIYGIISILLGLFLMKKFAKSYIMCNVSKIWYYSGFVTLLFGILFDEWGGMSHVMLLNYLGSWFGTEVLTEPLYHGFHRMSNILTLIGITALTGMIHLAIGFAIGAINEWEHNKKHAIAKIAWICVEVGMLLAILPVVGVVAEPALTTAGIIVLILSIIALGMTEGIIGIIELPGLLGNILSYTRIAAIGIVGIVIAEFLLNQFIIPLPEQGIFALVLLPIFLILHVVNAFLAMFESLVQGGRLNIVEFRSKFLHGGGEVFTPFTLKKK